MGDVEVHRLRAGEGSRLRALRLAALAQSRPALYGDLAEEAAHPPGHWEQRIALPGRATLVAVLDGDDVGLLHCGPPTWDTTADPREFDLGGTWVAPAVRGRGVSDALVTAALRHARNSGALAVTLWVFESNPAAVGAFARHGFRPTGRDGSDDGGVRYLQYRNELQYRHDLEAP